MSLSIIHLSDIHIKDESDALFSRVDKLKMGCVSSLPNDGDVVIVISGDIAFSGQKQQYEMALGLFKEIKEYIEQQKGSRVHFACVPGNHDCDFSDKTNDTVRDTLIQTVPSKRIDEVYYNTINCKQTQYNEFAKELLGTPDVVLPKIELSIGENKVLFLLANTAWMSKIAEQPGKIVMPCNLFEAISPQDYKAVFYVFHHPINWLNPDYMHSFIEHIRKNADIVLMGHEHIRDNYEKRSNGFSVYCSHGKELQDNNDPKSSAFSVLNFDNCFQTYEIIDFSWNGNSYSRKGGDANSFIKNIAASSDVITPNPAIVEQVKDMGITVKHFAKDNVSLSDLFVWPDLCKIDFYNDRKGSVFIRENATEELSLNELNILVGPSSCGKTSIAKTLFFSEINSDVCCLLLNGRDFTSSDLSKVQQVIELKFAKQYSEDYLEEFRQLPKEKRLVIVDDFECIKNNNDRRGIVLDFLCSYFYRVTILLPSSMEFTTLLSSKVLQSNQQFFYYEIRPLGNRKRKALISKWYRLNNNTLSEEEIVQRIEPAMHKIDIFLGNGAGFIPAIPVFIISALQNLDAIEQSFSGSKYGFLYESLIIKSLSESSMNYNMAGQYGIYTRIISDLAFNMLQNRTTFFSLDQLQEIIDRINQECLLNTQLSDVLKQIIEANLICEYPENGDEYRFKYPYIFYYFCGKYISEHIDEDNVIELVEQMSSKLYNETYGNIIIFVCHFSNKKAIIDDVLLNAYSTLDNYGEFDFIKSNPIFERIKEAVELLVPSYVALTDREVSKNQDNHLTRLDEEGINDGHVDEAEDTIDDNISEKEKDLASVISALKTIEVLGEILQNYPAVIAKEEKLDIIDEMHKLGMRTIQALINAIGYLESDLVLYVLEHESMERKNVDKAIVVRETRKFIGILISRMARGILHQVAVSLNSEHLLTAVEKALGNDASISAKLILADLNMNCLKKFSYNSIKSLKDEFESNNEQFASKILDSIIAQYLNYNTCDHSLRAKLCRLCGFKEKLGLIEEYRQTV